MDLCSPLQIKSWVATKRHDWWDRYKTSMSCDSTIVIVTFPVSVDISTTMIYLWICKWWFIPYFFLKLTDEFKIVDKMQRNCVDVISSKKLSAHRWKRIRSEWRRPRRVHFDSIFNKRIERYRMIIRPIEDLRKILRIVRSDDFDSKKIKKKVRFRRIDILNLFTRLLPMYLEGRSWSKTFPVYRSFLSLLIIVVLHWIQIKKEKRQT